MPDTQARAPSAALDDQVVDAADHGQAVAEARHQVGDAGGVVGLLLDGGDGGRFQQFGHHVRRQVHAIAARVVVEQDLEARGLRHAAVEGDRLACVGLIGQAGKHHQAIHAQFLGFAGVGGGARRAGFRQPGDDRHAAAHRFQRGAQHGQLFLGRELGVLAHHAHHHDAADAIGDQAFQPGADGVGVQRSGFSLVVTAGKTPFHWMAMCAPWAMGKKAGGNSVRIVVTLYWIQFGEVCLHSMKSPVPPAKCCHGIIWNRYRERTGILDPI